MILREGKTLCHAYRSDVLRFFWYIGPQDIRLFRYKDREKIRLGRHDKLSGSGYAFSRYCEQGCSEQCCLWGE
jgi:hypothetical protein